MCTDKDCQLICKKKNVQNLVSKVLLVWLTTSSWNYLILVFNSSVLGMIHKLCSIDPSLISLGRQEFFQLCCNSMMQSFVKFIGLGIQFPWFWCWVTVGDDQKQTQKILPHFYEWLTLVWGNKAMFRVCLIFLAAQSLDFLKIFWVQQDWLLCHCKWEHELKFTKRD